MSIQTGSNTDTANHDHLVEEQTAEAKSRADEAAAQIAVSAGESTARQTIGNRP
jgi:hypothetical protein